MKRLTLALLCLSGCPGPSAPVPPGGGAVVVARDAAAAEPDAASQEEKLAAIQKAMNELDEATQVCWAAAAVERFDIEGEIGALIDIEAAGLAKVTLTRDTTRNTQLASCVVAVLAKYPWAPPLHGQAIQLPFKFRAPDGQNVIDRALAPWVGQGKLAVQVLLDENNTGNGGISLVEVALQAGGSTGARIAERAELWYFHGPATVEAGATKRSVKAGDMMYVPANAARTVIADGDVHAVIAMVPGGREGSARVGALPTRELASTATKPGVAGPMILPATTAKSFELPNRGVAVIFAEQATIKDKVLASTILAMPGNAKVAEHVHATETEVLYVLAGTGTLTVDGVELAITPTSTVQIPPNTKHAFTATSDFKAVQIYTPAGPEQRFKK